MVATTLGKNLGAQMPQRDNDTYLHENQKPGTICTLSMTYQIDVVNKQLVPPLNRC